MKTTKPQFAKVKNTLVNPLEGIARREAVLLRQAEASGETVIVLGVACEVDGTFKNDFHDVRLPDGTVIEGLSGLHLEQLPTPELLCGMNAAELQTQVDFDDLKGGE